MSLSRQSLVKLQRLTKGLHAHAHQINLVAIFEETMLRVGYLFTQENKLVMNIMGGKRTIYRPHLVHKCVLVGYHTVLQIQKHHILKNNNSVS